MSQTGAEIFYNPLTPGYTDDPFPHLAEMRALDPVHESPIGRWVLFNYDDVFALLRDPNQSVDDRNIEIHDEERLAMFTEAAEGNLEEFESTSILGIDPPDHTRLRRLVSKAFTPRTIEGLRPRIQELVDDALNVMEAKGSTDIIADLAFPLPFDVITEMLGMPEGDTLALRDWSEAIVKTIDPIISEEEVQASIVASRAMNAHIDRVIAWKREKPGRRSSERNDCRRGRSQPNDHQRVG